MADNPNRGPFYEAPHSSEIIQRIEALEAGGGGGGVATLHGNGVPTDGVTGVGDESLQYMDDDTGVLYLNQGTLAVPEWHGVLNT